MTRIIRSSVLITFLALTGCRWYGANKDAVLRMIGAKMVDSIVALQQGRSLTQTKPAAASFASFPTAPPRAARDWAALRSVPRRIVLCRYRLRQLALRGKRERARQVYVMTDVRDAAAKERDEVQIELDAAQHEIDSAM